MTTENLIEKIISVEGIGDYKLVHTKFAQTPSYDMDPERGNRSTLYGPDGKILCVSPPHLSSISHFMENAIGKIHVTEFVEGTLINVFYDTHTADWDMMTKTHLGANNWFIRTEYESFMGKSPEDGKGFVYAPQHTFRQMFIHAIGGTQAYDEFVWSLDPEFIYSFVVQHPASPHTLVPGPAAIYLISYQRVLESDPQRIQSTPSVLCPKFPRLSESIIPDTIQFPFVYEYEPTESVPMTEEYWRHKLETVFCTNFGIVLTDESHPFRADNTPLQTVLLTPEYIQLRTLRGNDSNLMYMCIRLMQQGTGPAVDQMERFLMTFPWFQNIYKWTCTVANIYISELYKAYVDHYIHHVRHRYSPIMYHHMKQLHQRFLDAKKANIPFYMRMQYVFEYVQTLSVSDMHSALTEQYEGILRNPGERDYLPNLHKTNCYYY
jgi:hypothetical protein